jgi:glutamine synthetase
MFKSAAEAVKFIRKNKIVNIDFKACDLFGKWRHLTTPSRHVTETVLEEGFGFDGSSYGFRAVDKSDMVLIPDMKTGFIDPYWEQPTLAFVCNIHETEGNEPRFEQDPRFVCDKAEQSLKALGVGDELLLGPEFEFYLFDEVAFSDKMNTASYMVNSFQAHWNTGSVEDGNGGFPMPLKGGYHGEQPADRFASFRSQLCEDLFDMGIGVKYHHHEVGGPGQVEIETEFGTAGSMADKTMQIKYAVRNFAALNGLSATFMPKPMFAAPGNGFHVHFKLMNNNKPVFADPSGYAGMSKTAMHFMTGILVHARALSAFTNPSTNSYKRLVPGYEAPVSVVMATSNRSAAIRIPGYVKEPGDKRFEYRAGDATANPYLMFAAMIMAGVDGIRRKLEPEAENVGPLDGNIFELPAEEKAKIKSLPRNLAEALEALEADNEFLKCDNVFSDGLIKTWIKRKFEEEAKPVMLRPHPYEFELSFGC